MHHYKSWMTNCPADEAFERLVRYSAEDPDGYYTIGPPHETMTLCDQYPNFVLYGYREGPLSKYPIRGCTVAELERMDYRGIYQTRLDCGSCGEIEKSFIHRLRRFSQIMRE